MADTSKETLEMVFNLEDGRTSIMSVNEIKAGLTRAEVEAAAQIIIAKRVFVPKGVYLASLKDCYLRRVTTESMA